MKPVSKQEFQWLIKNNYIKQERGQLLDVKVSCGKSRRKTRYVTDWAFEKLKLMVDMTESK